MAKNYNQPKVYLNREALLGLKDAKIEELYVEEWDSTVYVRGLTAKELMDYVNETYDLKTNQPKDLGKSQIVMVGYCLCDENGDRLLQNNEIDLLADKSASAINKIFEVAQKLSGLGAENKRKN